MSLWKQAILALAAVGAALAIWVVFVPASRPWLDAAGLLGPMERLGLVQSSEAAEAEPARGAGASGGGGGGTTVIAAEPLREPMTDIVSAIGSSRGARAVTLSTEVSGRIIRLAAGSGDYVEAEAVVAELDAEAARIALDRAALMLDDARATSARLARLQASGTSTDLQAQEADLALQTTELAYREAEFELSRHMLRAPIAGWVGILAVEEGDRVATGDVITRIEDRSSLIVDFRVPERMVARMAAGMTLTAEPLAEPGRSVEGRIVALDNRVDEASRSLLVQAAIPNEDDAFRAGMAFAITLDFSGETYPAVDPLAIQWGSEGPFVWVTRTGKAMRLPVRILQRGSATVLIDADLAPGDLVVTEGVQALRPGADVTVQAAPRT